MSYGSFDFENNSYFTFVDQLLQGKGHFITPKTYVKSQANMTYHIIYGLK